ncbi:hypothetical protein [Variovorax sp. UC122_21]|uniref:hypothetical protein n=1 Tax=Variovorax sp. UC122_21 TaxID=3374554 RepID=UPI0037576B93
MIDDHIGTLVDRGDILRVQRGVYVPAVQHPPARAMSKTLLPDGWVKIEIGDMVLTLTSREDRMLATLQAGAAAQAIAIETGRNAALLAAELAEEIKRLRRRVAALEAPTDPSQAQLFDTPFCRASKPAANGAHFDRGEAQPG